MTKLSWAVTSVALMLGLGISAVADDLMLTLDLRNTVSNDPLSGGTWQLYGRKLETGIGAEGDFGLASVRALLENIDPASVTFAPLIGQPTTGGPYVQTLPNGTVELLYQQDLDGSVVTGVGVPGFVSTLDKLIASGTWPSGPRPGFGVDTDLLSSTGSFLSSSSAPYSTVTPDNIFTDVVTLGDMNGSGTVTFSDIAPFFSAFSEQFKPAADINQSGTLTSLDRAPFAAIVANRIPMPQDIAPLPSGDEQGSFYFAGDV